jgi:hypothetical protein
VRGNKAVLRDSGGNKQLFGGNVSGVGPDYRNGVSMAMLTLKEFDVYDKFRDPRLHTYMHTLEATTNVEPAYTLDRRRLEQTLARLGTVDYSQGIPAARESIRNLADGLKRLELPSTLATLHPIVAKGISDPNGPPNQGRDSARRVKNGLVNQGVRNPIDRVSAGGTATAAVVGAKPVDPAISNIYVASWSRFSAAHEFGHMIGLMDEYYGAASAETVKAMISAGYLPPDTRADHLKLNPTPNAQEKAGQEATQKLYARTGLETPDFALNAPGGADMPKTTSLMTGGFDVTQHHVITAWEALVTMTNGYLDEKWWKIT